MAESYPKDALKNKPEEMDLREIADNSSDNWESLLTYVGVKRGKIQTLKLNYPGSVANACFDGLVLWRGENTGEPATWSTLLAAMKKASMAASAREWEEKIIDRYSRPSGDGKPGNGHQQPPTPPAEEVPSDVPKLNNVKDFMDHFKKKFLKDVAVSDDMAKRLKDNDVIPEHAYSTVKSAGSGYIKRSEIWNQVRNQGVYGTLENLCDAMVDAKGEELTKQLGKQMEAALKASRKRSAATSGATKAKNLKLILSPDPDLAGRPTTEDLKTISRAAGRNKKDLLRSLGIEEARIDTLYENNPNNAEEACYKGLLFWENDRALKPVTWGTLIDALNKAELTKLANELLREVNPQLQQQDPSPMLSDHNGTGKPPAPTKTDASIPYISSVETFMEHFKEDFLNSEDVDPMAIVGRLEDDKLMPVGKCSQVKSDFEPYNKRATIYRHMRDQGTYSTLLGLCKAMKAASANKKTIALGVRMQKVLEQNLAGRPTTDDLRNISASGRNKKDLLRSLGIAEATIVTLYDNNQSNAEEACYQGLLFWESEEARKPVTWGTLIDALKKAKLTKLANELLHKVNLQLQQQDPSPMLSDQSGSGKPPADYRPPASTKTDASIPYISSVEMFPLLESKHFVSVTFFRGVKNAPAVRQKLIEGVLEAAVIDCRLILNPFQVLVAANKAWQTSQNGNLKTKSVFSEVLFSLSISGNISDCYRQFGINDKSENIIAVTFEDTSAATKLQGVAALVDGTVEPFEELSSVHNVSEIKKYYKTSHAELSTSSLLDCIVTQLATKDFS